MRRLNRFMKSPKTTIVAFGMAIVLLLFSSIGGTRAALNYFSDYYESQLEVRNIGVTLLEKNDGSPKGEAQEVSYRDYGEDADGEWNEGTGVLLDGMIGKEETLKLGKKYNEELSVRNTGEIDQYVRVSVYKYWVKASEDTKESEKLRNLDPELIELHFTTDGGWIMDEEASTKERTVLYYSKLLPAGKTTSPFTDTLKINNIIASKATQEITQNGSQKTIKTTYDYDGIEFCVEAKVDAVQDHNAEDAIWSAWGQRVTVNNGTLSLN